MTSNEMFKMAFLKKIEEEMGYIKEDALADLEVGFTKEEVFKDAEKRFDMVQSTIEDAASMMCEDDDDVNEELDKAFTVAWNALKKMLK